MFEQHFPRGEVDRGRHDAQEHAPSRILLHVGAVTPRACEGKPVKPSITLRWMHKQQLLHVNEKLPVNALATVPGCYPDSDMCGTSRIMSRTSGSDRSKEKENELTNSSGGGSSFYSFSPLPGVNELPTSAEDDFCLCVYCPPCLDRCFFFLSL